MAPVVGLKRRDDKALQLHGDQVSDCASVEWPRVCTEDLGHLNPGESPGYPINGRYGGKCALRPWDALDFSAVNGSIAVAPPARLNAWDVQSRAIMKVSKDILSATVGGFPVGEVPPLVMMSSVDAKHYPVHLDAIRVLIRMMINNPSLEVNTLPTLPDPSDLTPDILGGVDFDSSDPVAINAAAGIIASRVPWNPFYRLLSEGPTPHVKSMIIDSCPGTADKPDKGDWIWEKADASAGSKIHSMGWDCVFLGQLYNKMRVRKPVLDELFALFLKYADVLDRSLKQFNQALMAADAANQIAEKAVAQTQRDLNNALDFIKTEYTQGRQAAVNALNDATKTAGDLASQQVVLEKKAGDLAIQAASLPDRI